MPALRQPGYVASGGRRDRGDVGKYDGLAPERLVALLEGRDRQKKLDLVWERDEIEADRAVEAAYERTIDDIVPRTAFEVEALVRLG